jgi:threonine synthase
MEGLATDGGLYVPRAVPRLDAKVVRALEGATFAQTAEAVLTPFIGGTIPADALRSLLDRAYARFDHPSVAPLVEVAPRRWLLELFHGPTLAFKDHAQQILGPLMGHFLALAGREAFVLCATSGDTGGAALAALEGIPQVKALVLYPAGGVSGFQAAQMHALAGPGRRVVAVQGSFDECQWLVKQALGDAALREKYRLTAVNSVNWGRIAAQAVYYAHAALRLSRDGAPVDFAVPTGNFGNAYSGLVAQRMGFPVGRILVATNENDTLVRVAETGRLSPRPTMPTNTPAIDIQRPSNFERLLFDLSGDGASVAACLEGQDMTAAMRSGLGKGLSFARVHQSATLARMQRLFNDTGYIADPHTALALEGADAFAPTSRHLVTLATAHPAKFAETVVAAIGLAPLSGRSDPPPPAHLVVPIPPALSAVLGQIELTGMAAP